MLLAALAGCGLGDGDPRTSPGEDHGTHFVYDAAGQLAAVQQGGTTAVYRFDKAGNRVSVERVSSRDFDARRLGATTERAPKVADISPRRVPQGATVDIAGTGFDRDPVDNVVAVGGALGQVLSASPERLRVRLPPVATPGPITVSTAYGSDGSEDALVVVPAGVEPAEVTAVVGAEIGTARALRPGTSLLTFQGEAGDIVELHLATEDGCDVTEVGLAGPTGTIVDAKAGEESWCDRPATLPMSGTYTATVTSSVEVRATVSAREADWAGARTAAKQVAVDPPTAGAPGFPVDLSSGLLDADVTDLALGGSGAVDLRRTFSIGDPDLPALPPEQPLARYWSLAGSIALEPSMSNSYLDLQMPDGRRLPYRRVTPGAPEPDGAVFESSDGVGAGPFAGSRVSYTGSGWELKTRAGTVLGFGLAGSPKRLAWVRDADGRTARFVRSTDDLVGVISDDGQWARFDHDADGRIVTAESHVGDRVTYRYGRPDRVFSDVLLRVGYHRADGPATTIGYRYQPVSGRLMAVTDGRHDRVRFGYDDAGRVTREQVLRPAGPGARAGEWRFAYDVGKRRVRIPGRSGSITLPQINQVRVSGPDGHRTVSVRRARDGLPTGSPPEVGLRPGWSGDAVPVFVDARGRVAARRTANGAVTRVGHDPLDRPTSITDPGGGTTRLTYTANGDLASVTDGSGTTRYAWNAAGQQLGETDPLGGRQRWRYDRSGRLVWSQDARGVVSTFGYDRAGRVVTARYGVRLGKPESRVDYAYGRAGRLVRVRDSEGGSAILRYDAQGRRVGESTTSGTVTTAYDRSGNRTSLGLPGGMRLSYDYDADGRPVRLSLARESGRQSGRGSGSADVEVAPSYDEGGRLSGLRLPGGIRGRLTYSQGRPTRLTYTRHGRDLVAQRATYDSRGRVEELSGELGRPALPVAQTESRSDDAHQLTSAGADWTWDRAGHLLSDATRRYEWDVRGRLVAATGPEGRSAYGYDALGRRASVTTDGKTVRYLYDGDDVVQAVSANGTRTTYLRGPDGTPLVSTRQGSEDATVLLPDLFGNVAARVTADGSVEHQTFDPFGVPGSTNPPDAPGFRGLLTDPTGLLPMGARPYDPATGRFLSRDTWGIAGGDPDPYRYALGAPTVYTDPSGHAAECVGIALGWAMSVLGPGGGWDDYDALEDEAQSGQITQDEWAVRADQVSHDLWAGFDVVANVCGTTAIGSSAAALPLLGSSKVTSRVLGSLADDAVTGAAATRVGTGFAREAGVSAKARLVLDRFLRSHQLGADARAVGLGDARFAQRSFSESFSDGGAFGGRTIDDVAGDLRSGSMSAKDVPINVVTREGTVLITNTRSAQALTRAGIPRSAWFVADRTGDPLYERLLTGQLRRNGLNSSGVDLP